jgi:hypothetical protein
MAPFRFRLARVLQWYAAQSRLEENRLRDAASRLQALELRLTEQRAAILRTEQEIVYCGALCAQDLSSLEQYRHGAKIRVQQLENQRVEAVSGLEIQRQATLAARLRLKMIENLRDRRLASYQAELSTEIEEIAVGSHTAAYVRTLNSPGPE